MKEFNSKKSMAGALQPCPIEAEKLLCGTLNQTGGHKPSVRTLKIEADGDQWRGLTKPKIRLMGRWLEQAGFIPGNHVHVTSVAPGIIELRCVAVIMVDKNDAPVLKPPQCLF